MKPPTKNGPEKDEALAKVQLSVYKRYYELMERYHLDTLTWIEKAVMAGVEPEEVKRTVTESCNDSEYIEKCYNAAKYVYESANT